VYVYVFGIQFYIISGTKQILFLKVLFLYQFNAIESMLTSGFHRV